MLFAAMSGISDIPKFRTEKDSNKRAKLFLPQQFGFFILAITTWFRKRVKMTLLEGMHVFLRLFVCWGISSNLLREQVKGSELDCFHFVFLDVPEE